MKHFFVLLFLYYLRFFARLQLKKISLLQKLKGSNLIAIGVTASAGKTTTVKTIYAALSPFYKIKLNTKSSETGLSLNILDINTINYSLIDWFRILTLAPIKFLFLNWKSYQIYLTEFGIDAPFWPKNMDFLLSILNPDIAVFLNVNPVHAQNFKKPSLKSALNAIAKEKSKLTNSYKPNKLSIVNFDDPFVKNSINVSNQLLTIGSKDTDIQILSTTNNQHGFSADFIINNKKYIVILKNQIQPTSFATSLASSLLIANHLGLDLDKIITSLQANFQNEPSRSSLLLGIKNTTIIDSSYNSSPQAASEMLDILSSFPGQKIAVLGDMRELGPQTKISHRRLYKHALNSSDLIIGVGPYTQKYFKKSAKVQTFLYWWQALDFLKNQIKGGEVILVKGSQNTIYLEELVKGLVENKLDQKNLCRQSPYWLSVKQKFHTQFVIDQLKIED